jgi:hypothetical protein
MDWIDTLLGLAAVAVAGLAVKALTDLRHQIESMKRSVEDIGAALEKQHTETRNTLRAIAVSVDNTAGSLGRIEGAMQDQVRRRV